MTITRHQETLKTRKYDRKMTIVRYNIVLLFPYSRDFTIVLSYCCVSTIVVLYYHASAIVLSHYHHRTIVLHHCTLSFHHLIIVILLSYYFGFIIVLSRNHPCTIVCSPSHLLVFTIVIDRVFRILLLWFLHRTCIGRRWYGSENHSSQLGRFRSYIVFI